MALIPWADIEPDGSNPVDFSAEPPINQLTLEQFWQRDECLVSCGLDLSFAAVTTSALIFGTEVLRKRVWIPGAVATAGGPTVLVVVLEAHVNAGTGRVRCRIDGLTWVESGDVTATADTRVALELTSADVKASAGTEVQLVIEAKKTSGSGSITVASLNSACRIERRDS